MIIATNPGPPVSPGLRSRPSLSAGYEQRPQVGEHGVSPGLRSRPSLSVHLAAGGRLAGAGVSPGLRSRPSLSGMALQPSRGSIRGGVAGITVPAFVERGTPWQYWRRLHDVSPGLRSRPSLSVVMHGEIVWRGFVSPGLRSRPSLSEQPVRRPAGTAGVSPGLRSRPSLSALHRHYQPLGVRRVSPGLRSRPSLSGIDRPSGFPCHISVAGIAVPAFVKFNPSLTSSNLSYYKAIS